MNSKTKKIILFSFLLTLLSFIGNFDLQRANAASDSHLIIKDGVKTIGFRKYANNKNITKVTIPKSVKQINYDAFLDCTNLEEIIILSDDITIYNTAFNGTKWYDNQGDFVSINNCLINYKGTEEIIEIPKTINKISPRVFQDNKSIKKVTIPEGVTRIEIETFSKCDNLEEVKLPESLTYIGERAFAPVLPDDEEGTAPGPSSLVKVNIPKKIETIKEGAFFATPFLKNLGEFAIVGDGYLIRYQGSKKDVTLPNTVKYIGNHAFTNMIADEVGDPNYTRIESIKIPDSVIKIGESAFAMSKLTHITIGNGVTEIGKDAFSSSHLETVIFGNKVKTIGEGAFSYCSSLTSVGFPDSLKTIEEGAFASSKVSTAKIPASVTKIGKDAFGKAADLKLTIFGVKGSAAEKYAKSTKSTFKTLLATPKLTAYKAGTTKVTGTSVKNATISVTVNETTKSGKINSSGKFSITTAKLKKGDALEVMVKDSKGNKSRVYRTTVK